MLQGVILICVFIYTELPWHFLMLYTVIFEVIMFACTSQFIILRFSNCRLKVLVCNDSAILLIQYSNGLKKTILMLVTVHNNYYYVNQCRTKKYAAGLLTVAWRPTMKCVTKSHEGV